MSSQGYTNTRRVICLPRNTGIFAVTKWKNHGRIQTLLSLGHQPDRIIKAKRSIAREMIRGQLQRVVPWMKLGKLCRRQQFLQHFNDSASLHENGYKNANFEKYRHYITAKVR